MTMEGDWWVVKFGCASIEGVEKHDEILLVRLLLLLLMMM